MSKRGGGLVVAFLALAIAFSIVGRTTFLETGQAWADPYFNSSEPGCDPANHDPAYLMCDGFEDGIWYRTDCDTSGGESNPDNDGWCGTIYAPITPPDAAVCGNMGAVGTNCAATSGYKNGSQGGENMGEHPFPGLAQVDEVYARWYHKLSADFVPGHEKIMFFQSWFGDYQCCIFMFPFGSYQPDMQTQNGATARLPMNLGNTLRMIPGHWYYIEIHLKLNTPGVTNGIYELWMDDCGTNGLGCTGPGTLRARYTNRSDLRTSSTQHISEIWVENWANPGSVGTEYYDQYIVATRRIGPMGVTTAPDKTPPAPPTNLTVTLP